MTATVVSESDFLACEVAVLSALAMAGKRLRNVSRERRKQLIDSTPDYLLYVQLVNARDLEGCDRLLAGAWDHLALVLPDRPRLYAACDGYVRDLLTRRVTHTRDGLLRVLAGLDG